MREEDAAFEEGVGWLPCQPLNPCHKPWNYNLAAKVSHQLGIIYFAISAGANIPRSDDLLVRAKSGTVGRDATEVAHAWK